MIDARGYCDNCKDYHSWDHRHPDGCARAWVPLKRAPQPTIEEQSAAAIREIELKAVREHAARRREAERRDWERTMERSKVNEMLKHVHERKSADLAAKVDEVTAELAAARQQRIQQAKAGRLERRLAEHEQQARQRGRGAR